jgi:hypothetical protein
VQKDLQEREIRAQSVKYRQKRKFECDQEELTIRHNKSLEDLEKEKAKLAHNMQAIE